MLYPMYTISVVGLLKMTKLRRHEELKSGGDLVVFEDGMGSAGFVSHQWVSQQHPDPDFKQTRVLQDALRRMLTEQGVVPLDLVTEAMVPSKRHIPFQEFHSEALYLWYDYISVPQLDPEKSANDEQAMAINSIPAYVAKCRYFFALCPTIDCPKEQKLLNMSSWASRGWCRLERASRELSENESWILIQSSTALEVVGTAFSLITGSVGEGDFTVESDRKKLAPVMRAIVQRKLMLCLESGDFPGYRRHLNLQSVYLRGLDVEPLSGLAPDLELDEVAHFFHQNGLTKVDRKDSAGWWPIHYAALNGKVSLIQGLLMQRADPTRRTCKEEPRLGWAIWVSVLDLAVFYKHNEAVQLLIAARAPLEGGTGPAILGAATANNAEGIRLLCAAGARPLKANVFGVTALDSACGSKALAAIDELTGQVKLSPYKLSRGLLSAMTARGGSSELVHHLVKLKADVNFQVDVPRDFSAIARFCLMVKSLQHCYGRATMLTALSYHSHGMTPLMAALQAGQHEAAAALISAGASLDITNYRNQTAAHFAQGHSVSDWLQLGLQGRTAECRRVSHSALPEDFVMQVSI